MVTFECSFFRLLKYKKTSVNLITNKSLIVDNTCAYNIFKNIYYAPANVFKELSDKRLQKARLIMFAAESDIYVLA